MRIAFLTLALLLWLAPANAETLEWSHDACIIAALAGVAPDSVTTNRSTGEPMVWFPASWDGYFALDTARLSECASFAAVAPGFMAENWGLSVLFRLSNLPGGWPDDDMGWSHRGFDGAGFIVPEWPAVLTAPQVLATYAVATGSPQGNSFHVMLTYLHINGYYDPVVVAPLTVSTLKGRF